MTKLTASLLALGLVASAAPAFAADLPQVPDKPAAPPAASTTIGLEGSPEFFADPTNVRYGQVNDVYLKGTITENVGNGFSIGTSLQGVDKISNSPATYQYLADVFAAYKAKVSDAVSLTFTGGLGFSFGNTGYAGGVAVGTGTDPFLYYYGQAALDYKIDSNWTWNVVNVRLRDAFSVAWYTPKIQSGITYNIDASNAIYANAGYAWKDSGSGLKPDKFNIAVGYKYSF
ncbi:MAG TPA: hypothetical protein VHZ56_01885 [Devosia sp.]|nr:hypothetical protein [Devosia sp.]